MQQNKGVRVIAWVKNFRHKESINKEITVHLPSKIATRFLAVCVTEGEYCKDEMGDEDGSVNVDF